MTPRAAVVRFYIDADILGLGKVVASLRSDTTYPGDPGAVIYRRQRPPCPITSPEVLDPDWIPDVARRGWLIITRDSKIITNVNEIAAVRDNGAKMVALNQEDAKSKWGAAGGSHDQVAGHRGADRRAGPVHLARVAHRHDANPARLARA